MVALVLVGILVLAIGGCACVLWAERGGPPWARTVATVTLAAGALLRRSAKQRRRGPRGSSGDD
ncbi:hypothetical protein ACFWAR_05165 [Streptomyces sp. NPDC059917]|uniref:hypothetical protein n=1 Tax=Streptomyces sp. NPDC059917 TaxID=3347002 RepID=UPI00365F22F6